MQITEAAQEDLEKICTSEVDVIELLFPRTMSEDLRICFVAWLAFVCTIDDLLEARDLPDRNSMLLGCLDIIDHENSPANNSEYSLDKR